jgi:hypothetical protein
VLNILKINIKNGVLTMKDVLKKISTSLGLTLVSGMLLARNLTTTAQDGITFFGVLGQLFYLAAFVFGILILIQGGMALKRYSDNPQQAQGQGGIGKPLIYMAVGAILTGIGAWNGILQSSLLGEEDGGIETFNTNTN